MGNGILSLTTPSSLSCLKVGKNLAQRTILARLRRSGPIGGMEDSTRRIRGSIGKGRAPKRKLRRVVDVGSSVC